jgi:hypothetical protein
MLCFSAPRAKRWQSPKPPKQCPLFDVGPRPADPLIPPANSSPTSQAAARMAAPNFGSTCTRIFAFVAGRRAEGATRDEISRGLGLPIQSVCPGVDSLRRRGLLRQTKAQRLTSSGRPAAVLVASRPGDGGQADA